MVCGAYFELARQQQNLPLTARAPAKLQLVPNAGVGLLFGRYALLRDALYAGDGDEKPRRYRMVDTRSAQRAAGGVGYPFGRPGQHDDLSSCAVGARNG